MGDDTIKKNISKNISKYRELAGMSQKELAKRLGVVPSRVSNWETGANCPTIDILFEVCDILNVSINDIYGVYPESKFVLEYSEQEFLKKYRSLDERGKRMVDSVLEEAYATRISYQEGQLGFPDVNNYWQIFTNGRWIPYASVEKGTFGVLPDFFRSICHLSNKEIMEIIDRYESGLTSCVNAAHALSNATAEDIKHDEDIMDDDDF